MFRRVLFVLLAVGALAACGDPTKANYSCRRGEGEAHSVGPGLAQTPVTNAQGDKTCE